MKELTLTLAGIAVLAFSAKTNALETQEIVNKALPSVVAMMPYNETTKVAFTGTGWFISSNRIVTNSHVVTGDFTGISIINVATGQKYTVDHVSYNNVATDVAIVTVVEANSTHLDISVLNPAVGMNVVIVGNPDEQYGKVFYGKLGGTNNGPPDKQYSGTLVEAPIIAGSSGSPVLDTNGDVIAMIWGSADPKKGGEGYAVNLQTLTLANLATVDLHLGKVGPLIQAAPIVVPKSHEEFVALVNKAFDDTDEFAGLVVPTKFGETVQGKDVSFTAVEDGPAFKAIATPVVLYMQESLKGTDCAGLFFQRLLSFYGEENITYPEVKAKDDAYNQKWVCRSIKIDYANVTVLKINWDGPTRYLVCVPFSFKMTDKKGKVRSGSSVTAAYVQPSRHTGDNSPDYFIARIGDAGKKVN